jgi:hypothetical protein
LVDSPFLPNKRLLDVPVPPLRSLSASQRSPEKKVFIITQLREKQRGISMSKGDLLIFVPDSIIGGIIDLVTGSYGYSHVAVDIGNREMIEATVEEGVVRSSIDKYGDRAFVRINMSDKIDVDAFTNYLEGKVDRGYDILEALTFGLINDPDKYTCSGLVAAYSEMEKLGLKGFVTPNELAKALGAPPGKTIEKERRESGDLEGTLEMLKRRREALRQQLKNLEEKEREIDREISNLLDKYNECTEDLPPFDPQMEECDKIKEEILELYRKKEEIYTQESEIAEALAEIERQINEIVKQLSGY